MKWFLLKIHVYEIPKITVAFLKQANTKGKIPEPEGIVLGMMRSKRDETFPYKCRDLYITYFSCLWLDLKFVRKSYQSYQSKSTQYILLQYSTQKLIKITCSILLFSAWFHSSKSLSTSQIVFD